MAELPPLYPSSPLTNEKLKRQTKANQHRKEKYERRRFMLTAAAPHT